MDMGSIPKEYKKMTGSKLIYGGRGELKKYIHQTECSFLRCKRNNATDWVVCGYSEHIHGPLSNDTPAARQDDRVLAKKNNNENDKGSAADEVNCSEVYDDDKEEEEDIPVDGTIIELDGEFKPITIYNDFDTILELLPENWKEVIQDKIGTDLIRDICLDVGRLPHLWANEERHFLSETSYVTREDIEDIVSKVGRIGSDNRCGFDRELHRVSCIRNNATQEIIGMTIRVGRHVEGNTDIIRDLLSHQNCSILILGEVSVMSI